MNYRAELVGKRAASPLTFQASEILGRVLENYTRWTTASTARGGSTINVCRPLSPVPGCDRHALRPVRCRSTRAQAGEVVPAPPPKLEASLLRVEGVSGGSGACARSPLRQIGGSLRKLTFPTHPRDFPITLSCSDLK